MGSLLPLIGVGAISQPFDMITMLGFLILLGVVVNNPILIVDRTLANLRDGVTNAEEAVREAVGSRLRPIMMSMITTLFRPGASGFHSGRGHRTLPRCRRRRPLRPAVRHPSSP